jgi:ribosomal protein S18 acetylase RimI-like enzyme
VHIRPATEQDKGVLHELWEEFHSESPPPDWWDESWDDGWAEMRGFMQDGFALLAEENGAALGYALARVRRPRVVYLNDIYVRPHARRRGVAKELINEVVAASRERGVEVMMLNVDSDNSTARAVYRRLGFLERSLGLIVELERREPPRSRSESPPAVGYTHEQTSVL